MNETEICSCDVTAYIGLNFVILKTWHCPVLVLSYYLTHNGTNPMLKRGTVYCVYLQHAPVQSMVMVLQYDGTAPMVTPFTLIFNIN